MFGVWPSEEIGPALADQFQRQRRTQTINLRQVDAEDGMQCGPRIEGWRSGRFVSITSQRQLVRGFGCNVSKAAQDRLDPQIALHDLGVVGVVKLQRPSESKDVLLTPVSGRRGSDLLLRGMAAPITISAPRLEILAGTSPVCGRVSPLRAPDRAPSSTPL